MKSRDCSPSSKIERRVAVEQARGEDRGDAGVRVRQRLARAVDVEEAQRDRRDAVGRAGDEAQLLVVALGDRVDRGRDQRLGLAGADRRSCAVPHSGQCTSHSRASSCSSGRGPGATRPCVGALVLALAVDRHRGGDDEPRGIGRARRPRARGSGPSPSCCVRCSARSRTSTGRRRRRRRGGRRGPRPARARSGGRASPTSPSIEARRRREARRGRRRGPAPRGCRGRRPRRRAPASSRDEVRADEAGASGDECAHADFPPRARRSKRRARPRKR